jgi:C-terminal processing protease CtpA/Prc
VIAVNGQDTSTSTYYEILKLLKGASRPITLGFQSTNPINLPSANAGADYQVTIQSQGALGILLGNNPDGSDLSAVVDQVSGPAAESGKIQIGHFLVSVNGQSTLDLNYYQTLSALKNASRPITLEFNTAQTPAAAQPYSVSLSTSGPLGILLGSNPSGPDVSAVVESVESPASESGIIQPGHYLFAVNKASTLDCDYYQTLGKL